MDAAGELAVVPSCFHGGSDSCFLGAPGATGSPSGAMSGQGRGVVFSCRSPPSGSPHVLPGWEGNHAPSPDLSGHLSLGCLPTLSSVAGISSLRMT